MLCVVNLPALATNGIILIGYGAESVLMGGADTAVARDTSALNTNPAGLAHIKGKLFDGYGSLLRTTNLEHVDALNDQHADNRYTLLAGGGYAQTLENLPCTAAIGFFTQGGAGAVFKHINTPFATNDEMYSLFGIAKVTPGMGCKINDQLSVGASVSLIYANINQELFYKTSVPGAFSGFKNKDAYALRAGLKVGAQYRLNAQWTLGASYTEKTELPLTRGTATFNFGTLGEVHYRDMRVQGLALPRELALGAAFKPDDQWLLSVKLNWIQWSNAIQDITTEWREPDAAFAPSQLSSINHQHWHDQLVYALGTAYTLDNQTTLYAGYNYGKNPVPKNNSSALLAATLEHHLTFGFARKLDDQWKLTSGIEVLMPKSVTYDSELFGTNSEVHNGGFFIHTMLSKQW